MCHIPVYDGVGGSDDAAVLRLDVERAQAHGMKQYRGHVYILSLCMPAKNISTF